jgi:glyoxylase-like metal-dependent hydrolase (beta-lactamase superfamily II)
MKTNKYLIRFFQVGSGSKGGDAILIRLFDGNDKEHLVLIDGGYKETGDSIIKYIKSECSTLHIDVVFNTHPDKDHISGLVTVLDNDDITVGALVLNRPWKDAKFTKEMFDDSRITANSLIKRLKDAFGYADDLEQVARDRKIDI